MNKKKPILNLQKGCPFCGNMNLVSGYNPTQNEVKIACRSCNYFITFKVAPPMYVLDLAEAVWNSRAIEKKLTAKIQNQQQRLSYQNSRILSHM